MTARLEVEIDHEMMSQILMLRHYMPAGVTISDVLVEAARDGLRTFQPRFFAYLEAYRERADDERRGPETG